MEIRGGDFIFGLVVGGMLGIGLALAVARVRGWLGYSETYRLKTENQQLKRRLAEKDRHIGKMLSETERLAEKLGRDQSRPPSEASGSG